MPGTPYSKPHVLRGHRLWAAVLAAALLGSPACTQEKGPSEQPVSVRLGYFPTLAHAPASVGLASGIFKKSLGAAARLDAKPFNAGPAVVEGIFSGAIDIAYLGPNPTLNAYLRSQGQAVRVVSGSTLAGVFLVVQPTVVSPVDLKGKTVASPQLGNTQDVALRTWLASKNLKTAVDGTGDVSVVPEENAQALQAFDRKKIAGAWVPEPWATRMIRESGGKVLVDERDLWPDGRYTTAVVVARSEFLKDHRAIVKRFIRGHVDVLRLMESNPNKARELFNTYQARITGKRLDNATLEQAWGNMSFTADPIASSLRKSAEDAMRLELLPRQSLDGLGKLYDLVDLNQVLQESGLPKVKV